MCPRANQSGSTGAGEGIELSPVARLTQRERDVLRLLLAGRSRKEIAGDLGVSFETAKEHLHNAYVKLDVESIAELCALVMRTPALLPLMGSPKRGIQ